MSDVEYAIVVTDDEAGNVLALLDELDDTSGAVTELQGLGGSIDEWMLAGAVAVHLVTRLLKAIYPYVEGRRIVSIKAGDVEIMRPRPEDVTRALELLANKPEQPETGA
jgi:hypothetical protein